MDDRKTWDVSDAVSLRQNPNYKDWLTTQKHDEFIFLNVGCGYDYMGGWINVDKQVTDQKVDVTLNLEDANLPFEDNSVGLIRASHVLEHINNYINLMKEFHRVLIPNGILYILVPEFGCRAAIADPDHRRFFVPESFAYLSPTTTGDYDSSGIKGLFTLEYIESQPYDKPGLDYMDSDGNVIGWYFMELEVELEAVK